MRTPIKEKILSIFIVLTLIANIAMPVLASEQDSFGTQTVTSTPATTSGGLDDEQHPDSKPSKDSPTTSTPGTTSEPDEQESGEAPEEPAKLPAPEAGTFGIALGGIDLFASTPGNQPAKIVADNHCLMLRVDGRLFGWGDNTYGQLGLGPGAPEKIYTPTEITFFADNSLKVKDVYAIADASFALCSNGELYSTGKGLNGRLGLGDTNNRNTWTLVPGSQTFRFEKLYGKAGQEYIIAATGSNELYGWGRNNYGQVGNNTKVDVLTPTLIMSSADIKHINTGIDFVTLLKQDNSYWVWGNNDLGRYGFNTGTIAPSNTALSMGACTSPSDQYCTYISDGHTHAFGSCTGKWSTYAAYTGIKGNNQIISLKEFTSPQKIVTGADREFSAINTLAQEWNPVGTANGQTTTTFNFKSTAVHSHTHNKSNCSRNPSCTYAPLSSSGATSTGTATWQYVLPDAFSYFDTGKIYDLQLGNRHGIVNIDGTYYGWGDNSLKQQGADGNANGYMVPLPAINNLVTTLENGEGFSELVVANDTSFVISGTGNVFTWGSNANGKAGTGSASAYIDTPTQVTALNGKAAAKIIPGRNHEVVLTHTGDVYTMGDNLYGQLGLGDAYKDEIKAASPILIETFKFSETAAAPDAPDGINTPDEVEAGTDFEIHWTSVSGADKYEIVRHFTPESDSILLLASDTAKEEVIYTGDQTKFTDTVYSEGTVYYTASAVSFLGDYSAKATSGDILVLPSSNNGGNDNGNNNNNNNNNGGGGLTDEQLLQIIAALKSNGVDDDLIAALIESNKKDNSSGGVNVDVNTPATDTKDLAALIAALAANNDERKAEFPATNVYNQPSDFSPLVEFLGAYGMDNEPSESSTVGSDEMLNRVLTVAVLKLLVPELTSAEVPTEPIYYNQQQSSSGFSVTTVCVIIIIAMISATIALIVIRTIPETEEG